ncbi:hypothetical protein BHE74_00001277 [Ensete ventricosum]|nr:hypothetical protein BHE74_00001277 [Ensete ventricosum]
MQLQWETIASMGLCCSDRGVGLHKSRVTEVAVRGDNRGRLKKRQRKQRGGCDSGGEALEMKRHRVRLEGKSDDGKGRDEGTIWQRRERRALATTEVATEIDSGITARTPRIIALIPIDRNPYATMSIAACMTLPTSTITISRCHLYPNVTTSPTTAATHLPLQSMQPSLSLLLPSSPPTSATSLLPYCFHLYFPPSLPSNHSSMTATSAFNHHHRLPTISSNDLPPLALLSPKSTATTTRRISCLPLYLFFPYLDLWLPASPSNAHCHSRFVTSYRCCYYPRSMKSCSSTAATVPSTPLPPIVAASSFLPLQRIALLCPPQPYCRSHMLSSALLKINDAATPLPPCPYCSHSHMVPSTPSEISDIASHDNNVATPPLSSPPPLSLPPFYCQCTNTFPLPLPDATIDVAAFPFPLSTVASPSSFPLLHWQLQ